MVKDEAVIPALLEQHVPLEVVEEVVTERETEAGWYDRVAAFHRSLPEDLREFVTIDGWNTGTARTPTMLGVGEHDRRKAHLEAFFHRERLAFTVECGSEFSENACRPLSRERIAALTGMVVA
jgi:hypothetical protein